MRVITGIAKGRRLQGPVGHGTRPMLDRVKESLFSVLEGFGGFRGGHVLDLYAGTGALGIECLSRGATGAVFVERGRAMAAVIRENLERTGLREMGRVVCMPVGRFLTMARERESYDIIIMDPPYADDHIEAVIGRLATSGPGPVGSLLVVGHSPRVPLADDYGGYTRLRLRQLGDSCFSIYERVGEDGVE
jgi:16S rRNA (guanine966-N2)-methyltransferase